MKSVRKKAAGAAVAVAAAAGIAVSGPVLAGVDTSPAPAVQQDSGSTVAPMAGDRGPGGNPYSAREVCGAGYRIVDDPGGINNKAMRPVKLGDEIWGYVFLLYNSSTGQNCVTTIKTRWIGTPKETRADLTVEGGGYEIDKGKFKYYAGPVKLPAADRCVKYRGFIIDTSTGVVLIARGGRPSWGNCG